MHAAPPSAQTLSACAARRDTVHSERCNLVHVQPEQDGRGGQAPHAHRPRPVGGTHLRHRPDDGAGRATEHGSQEDQPGTLRRDIDPPDHHRGQDGQPEKAGNVQGPTP